jgi:prepilin-type N-terminal cleavage/methylation domain-containing protein
MLRSALSSERGFSLVELLVAITVVALLMAGLLAMLQSGQDSFFVGSSQVEAQQNVRLAVDRMVRDLRNARYCPTCATCTNPTPAGESGPFPGVTGQSATGFTIQNDWNGDYNCVNGAGINNAAAVTDADGVQRGEQIIYAYNAGTGTLTRREIGIDAAAVPLAAGINGMTFTYLDANGAVTAVSASIRAVVVTVTGQPAVAPAAHQAGKVRVTMTDTVRLRNIGQ